MRESDFVRDAPSTKLLLIGLEPDGSLSPSLKSEHPPTEGGFLRPPRLLLHRRCLQSGPVVVAIIERELLTR